jgi:hypothetical protein
MSFKKILLDGDCPGDALEATSQSIKAKTDALPSDPASISAILPYLKNGTGSPLATNTSLKDMIDNLLTNLTFQHQPDQHLVQPTPEQNTWYTILDTTLNCRLYSVVILVWGANETLEVRITIDGQVLTGSIVATAVSYYWVYLLMYTSGFMMSGEHHSIGYDAPLEGRSIKVEMRKTTNAGTGTIEGYAIYAKR